MRLLLTLLACAGSLSLFSQNVILTGVLDGTGSGGTPRAVEIYVQGTVDLSGYTINRYANGSSSAGDVNALSGTFTDTYVYLINSSQDADFTAAFGTAGSFGPANRITGAVFGSGDDVFTLENNGTVVDIAGETIGVRNNTYNDSYIYRNDGTGPDGNTWTPGNWMNVGNNDALIPFTSFADLGAAVPFGTYQPAAVGPTVTVTDLVNAAEPATDGSFTIRLNQAATSATTVTYSLSGTAIPGTDYTDASAGSVTIASGQTDATVTIEVIDDNDSEPTETITLELLSVSDATFALGAARTIDLLDDEPVGVFPIHSIQGNGTASTLVGQTVSISGVVVGDFQGGSGVGLNGFFVQEEDADADTDPLTSEGIWVFDNGSGTAVAEGNLVTVTGDVSEFGDLTQLDVTGTGGSVVINNPSVPLPTATGLDLPLAQEADLERYEGMRITLLDDVYVTSNFGLARFGEVEVSEGERLIQFTECNDSDPAGLAAYNLQQDLRRLIIDDGRSGDNNFPLTLPDGTDLTPTNTLRAGTVLRNVVAIVDERFTGYRLQPVEDAVTVENARPAAAPNVGGNLTVVGMNVLNYFTTLNSRGADNATEFDRQEAKIVAAICELDADILGLVEIENNGYGANGALQTLIDAIAAECGTQYSFVTSPNTGTDQIQVALIYKSSVVMESGTAAALSTPNNVFSSNRVPLAQTFEVIDAGNPAVGKEITVCVNHWKSKGGSCGAGDDDNGGAGSCNGTRLAAAQAIRTWLATNPTGQNVSDQLVIGDLNAYSQEDPILEFTDNGWANTVRQQAGVGSFPCGSRPSYVFRGEWGSLDHALASPSLAGKITGAQPWEVNAAEPTALDYDTDFNDPALYADDFYRFSDHDPVVVGIDLGTTLPVTLLTFTGEQVNNDVELDWATSSEEMSDRFFVERRTAAGTFATIGEVAAAGNSSSRRDYSFTDTDPFAGNNVYRLRIRDLDGSEVLSGLVTVNVDLTNSIGLVARGERIYRLSGAPVGTHYFVTTAGGALIRTGKVTNETADVDGAGWPAGIYFLGLTLPDGSAKAFRLVLP